MSPNSTIQPSRFLYRKWILLIGIVVLVALVAVVALSGLSITIKSYPSCLTYQSEGDAQLGPVLRASFGNYLTANGFAAVSSQSDDVMWTSRSTFVQWSDGSKLWLNVCTKSEESSAWLAVAQDIQQLALRAHWAPEAWLGLNPDVTECKSGNSIPLGYPVDFKEMGAAIEHVKATCGSRNTTVPTK